METNPHKPGSEEWHRFNLGIKPGVIGQVESVEMHPNGGLFLRGWFWGDVPKTLADMRVDFDTGEALSIKPDEM